MSQINLIIKGTCMASLYATKSVLGKDVETNMTYVLAPGSAKMTADKNIVSFTGTDIKAGYIRADIKTEDIRSFFINVQRIRIGLVVGGIIMIVIGAILAAALFFIIIPIFIGISMIVGGIVMLVKGLIREIYFTVRVTSHLFNFVMITLRSITGSDDFKNFINSFWSMVNGEYISQERTTEYNPPVIQQEPVHPTFNNPQSKQEFPMYTCNVCMEQFDSQEQLLNHKRELSHW